MRLRTEGPRSRRWRDRSHQTCEDIAMANDVSPGAAVPPGMKAFFSISELAARWGTSKRTVQRFIADGRIEVVRIGRSVRIATNEVMRFEAMRRSLTFL